MHVGVGMAPRSDRGRALWSVLLVCAELAFALPAANAKPAELEPGTGTLEPTVAGVVLNAVAVSNGELLYADPALPQSGVWVRLASLAEWRLIADTGAARSFDGVAYGRLCGAAGVAEPGLTCFFDDSSALLTLVAGPSRIVPLQASVPRLPRSAASDPGALGGYANYELFAVQGKTRLQGVATEGHLFSGSGTGYLNLAVLQFDGRVRITTRMAGWQWDMPEPGTSLALGGVLGSADSLQPLAPLLGIRYGSNAALRPDISRVQLPWVAGSVERSSRADLFVDGLFRRSAEVPYGPFSIEADALWSGRGQLQLVQTDQRGEQTVRNVDYYFAPQLLPTGLTDHVTQAGLLSADAARLSLRGEPVAMASVRRGLADDHTAGVSVMLASHARLLSGVSDLKLGDRGVLRSGLAAFDRGDGPRWRGSIGHEYQSRRFSSVLRVEATARETAPEPQPGETRLVAQTLLPIDRRSVIAALSWNLNERVQLSASALSQTGLSGDRRHTLGVFGTWRPSSSSQISFGVQRISQLRSGTLAQLSWLLPLGPQHLAVASVQHTRERSTANWSVQSLQTGLDDEHAGQYRVFGQAGPGALVGAAYQKDEDFGRWRSELQSSGNQTTLRAGLGGSVGWMQGHAFLARRIDDSFIVVDTDGQPDVPIYFENRYAGKTNRDGKLLLPDARAYQPNQVSIDASSLPIEYTLAQDQIRVVPGSRAGTPVRFEISDGGILILVLSASGERLPPGARVVVSTQTTPAVVGSRSEIFISRAKQAARVEVAWAGGRCSFDYRPEAAPDASAGSDGAMTCR